MAFSSRTRHNLRTVVRIALVSSIIGAFIGYFIGVGVSGLEYYDGIAQGVFAGAYIGGLSALFSYFYLDSKYGSWVMRQSLLRVIALRSIVFLFIIATGIRFTPYLLLPRNDIDFNWLDLESDRCHSFDLGNLGQAKGAYVLLIDLVEPVGLYGRFGSDHLPPGRYSYCGSAYGSGGLAARLRRHLRKEKPLHWHIDPVTVGGTIVEIGCAVGGQECGLVEPLRQVVGARFSITGFGSTDCKACTAHLLEMPERFCLESIDLLRLEREGG